MLFAWFDFLIANRWTVYLFCYIFFLILTRLFFSTHSLPLFLFRTCKIHIYHTVNNIGPITSFLFVNPVYDDVKWYLVKAEEIFLQGSLPLVLMFDLPEDSMSSVDSENVSQLMQSLDVFINVRHKPKQSTLSVIIKGIERNASNIYEARKQLLGLDEPRVHAEIPATYHIPNAGNIFQGNSTGNGSGEYDSIDFTDSFSDTLSNDSLSSRWNFND